MSGLLTLTFHLPNTPAVVGTMAEDLVFKKEAIASGLITKDAMQEAGKPPEALMALPTTPLSGLIRHDSDPTLISVLGVGPAAWARPPFRKPAGAESVFENWMKKVFVTPIECLVLAGHHSGGELWGLEGPASADNRPYTKFVPVRGKTQIAVRGLRLGSHEPAPFDVGNALRTCRLLLIWGCNGASIERGHWAPWRDLIVRCSGVHPLILGYYKTHRWARDDSNETFSAFFWKDLKALAGGSSITRLCKDNHAEVIKIWVSSMQRAFGANRHCNGHLFFQQKHDKKRCKGHGPRGAGAVDPTGVIWHVVDSAGTLKPR